MPFKFRHNNNIKNKLLLLIIPVFIVFSLIIGILFSSVFYYFLNRQTITLYDKLMYDFASEITSITEEIETVNLKNLFSDNKTLSSNGIMFILDNDDKIIYSNYGESNLGFKHNIDENILNEESIKKLLNDDFKKLYISRSNYNTVIANFTYKYNYYQVYFCDSTIYANLNLKTKYLYFYPRIFTFTPVIIILSVLLILFLIIISVLILFLTLFNNSITHSIFNLSYAIDKINKGSMNFILQTESNDEMGILYKNFSKMTNSFINNLLNIQRLYFDLTGFLNSNEKVIKELNNSLKVQNDYLTENSVKFERLNNLIINVMEKLKEASNVIDISQQYSNDSILIINQMVEEINKIADTSQEINFITELINGISEKTRLLSVNSAIEASRAGETGKGFSVVAIEIKNLAIKSKDAAKQIGELIKTNDSKILSGVNKTTEVNQVLNNIKSSINMINDIVKKINLNAQEQNSWSSEINGINNLFSQVIKENNNYLENLEKINSLLKTELDKMNKILSFYTLKSSENEIISDVKLIKKEYKNNLNRNERLETRQKLELKNQTGVISNKLIPVRGIKLYKPGK